MMWWEMLFELGWKPRERGGRRIYMDGKFALMHLRALLGGLKGSDVRPTTARSSNTSRDRREAFDIRAKTIHQLMEALKSEQEAYGCTNKALSEEPDLSSMLGERSRASWMGAPEFEQEAYGCAKPGLVRRELALNLFAAIPFV